MPTIPTHAFLTIITPIISIFLYFKILISKSIMSTVFTYSAAAIFTPISFSRRQISFIFLITKIKMSAVITHLFITFKTPIKTILFSNMVLFTKISMPTIFKHLFITIITPIKITFMP